MTAVDAGRRLAESLMADTFTAYRPNGTTIDASGDEVPAYVVVPYSSDTTGTPGKVQGNSAVGKDPITRTVVVGGVDRPIIEGGLQIPLSAPVPVASETRGVGWEYVCTAVGPRTDPALLGKRYLVVNAPVKSYATARRLDVVEVPA